MAELVREQLLAKTRDELPHAITCRVTEWEWPHIRVEIIVERDSQKAIVIGKGGEVLKAVGHRRARGAARGHLPRPAREGRAALAEPRRDARPPRLLSAWRYRSGRHSRRPWAATQTYATGLRVLGCPTTRPPVPAHPSGHASGPQPIRPDASR